MNSLVVRPVPVKQTVIHPAHRQVLEAISRGEVADRFSRFSLVWSTRWHTRNGRPLRSAGRGGGLGRNITGTIAVLVRAGLAERTDGPRQYADRPYRLTEPGKQALAAVGGNTVRRPPDAR